jgi:hypothetical protein
VIEYSRRFVSGCRRVALRKRRPGNRLQTFRISGELTKTMAVSDQQSEVSDDFGEAGCRI